MGARAVPRGAGRRRPRPSSPVGVSGGEESVEEAGQQLECKVPEAVAVVRSESPVGCSGGGGEAEVAVQRKGRAVGSPPVGQQTVFGLILSAQRDKGKGILA
jgi:hypothetical protein